MYTEDATGSWLCEMLFRRSSSRKARRVRGTLERLSQKSGGKFGRPQTLLIDLSFFLSGWSLHETSSTWTLPIFRAPHGPGLPNLVTEGHQCAYLGRTWAIKLSRPAGWSLVVDASSFMSGWCGRCGRVFTGAALLDAKSGRSSSWRPHCSANVKKDKRIIK